MHVTRVVTSYVLLSCLLLFGCSEDGDDSPTDTEGGPPPAGMVGAWTFQSVTVDGNAAALAEVLEWTPLAVAAKFTIEANGAYVYEEVDSNGGQLWFENGFVFVNGNEIDVNVLFDGDGAVNETSALTYILGAGFLTLSEAEQGTTTVFTLTR